MSSDLTICSVVTRLHYRLLALNQALIAELNPYARPQWRIVDNGREHLNKGVRRSILAQAAAGEGKPVPDDGRAAKQKLWEEADRFADPGTAYDYFRADTLIEGYTADEALEHFAPQRNQPGEDETRRRVYKALASYHHAAAINRAMDGVRTRFALLLDPDFYVIRPDWIAEAVAMMKRRGLAVFGAPWHPRWFQKYRGLPCTHLMLIDLERIPWRTDLLSPDLLTHERFVSEFWTEAARDAGTRFWPLVGKVLRSPRRAIREGRIQRKTIGTRNDTGYRMKAALEAAGNLRSDFLVPVFEPERQGFQPPAVTALQYGLREAFLPESRRYLPRSGASARTGFRERGLGDPRALDWEEFLWEGNPYAFHVRGEMHRKSGRPAGYEEARRVVNAVLASQGRPCLPEAVGRASAMVAEHQPVTT